MNLELISTANELKRYRKSIQGPVAFVPTMGNLHAGHLSLAEQALKDCDYLFFSIFVNPTQFGPNDDLDKYPRTLEHDLQLLSNLNQKYPNKKIIVFHPESINEIYPEGFSTFIDVDGLDDILEGKRRPGHFTGVATVVYLLFSLVKPSKSYFGQKDYEQLLVIKKMVHDLNLEIEIIGMPIIRDTDGLALSSRNQYLTSDERKLASLLPDTLLKLKTELINSKDLNNFKAKAENILQDENWDYLELRDAETLDNLTSIKSKMVLLGVYKMGKTRLLDNQLIET
jgi:pantoate--beta-alanine ligase